MTDVVLRDVTIEMTAIPMTERMSRMAITAMMETPLWLNAVGGCKVLFIDDLVKSRVMAK